MSCSNNFFQLPKGQLISKCLFCVTVLTKVAMYLLSGFICLICIIRQKSWQSICYFGRNDVFIKSFWCLLTFINSNQNETQYRLIIIFVWFPDAKRLNKNGKWIIIGRNLIRMHLCSALYSGRLGFRHSTKNAIPH